MGVILEIKAGPMAGKVIGLKNGESVTIGRAAGRAQFALPHDTFMSGVHLAVECGPQGCRVQDRKSSNGTFLNGARINDAMLANGDEIKGGQTIFSVKIVSDAKLDALTPLQEIAAPGPLPSRSREAEPPPPARPPASFPAAHPAEEPKAAQIESAPQALPPAPASINKPPMPAASSQPLARPAPHPASSSDRASESRSAVPRSLPQGQELRSTGRTPEVPRGLAFSVMGWSFPAAPAEWQVQEGFGLQQSGHEEFPSSLAASEEFLGGITLQQFVESQISVLRGYLRDPQIEPAMPPRVGGADESMAVDVRHSTKDGRELVYRRIYARSGASVGVLTVTTLAADLPQVLQSLQPLLEGADFHSTVNN